MDITQKTVNKVSCAKFQLLLVTFQLLLVKFQLLLVTPLDAPANVLGRFTNSP